MKKLFQLITAALLVLFLTPLVAFASDYQTKKPEANDPKVILETTMGTIKFKLFPEVAPKASENFWKLSEKGYYNGLTFHRVIKDFMIQGGDPKGDGSGGESFWGGTFNDEFSSELTHLRGAVAMANSGANTNGSQFFICQKEQASLNNSYTVFGQVYEGMDVVDKIAKVKTDKNDKPIKSVKINKVSLEGKFHLDNWWDKNWMKIVFVFVGMGAIIFIIWFYLRIKNRSLTRAERRRKMN